MTVNISDIDDLIKTRRSCRAFLPDTIPESVIREILDTARWAPSGSNTQPWKVRAVSGKLLESLRKDLAGTDDTPEEAAKHKPEYAYYPAEWRSPYIERRRKVGIQLYQALGIPKGEKELMHKQHNRNFKFFDAPSCLVFTIDKDLNQGSWLDYGFFLQNILMAAAARGLGTCVQVGPNRYHKIFRKHLNIPDTEMMVCCIILGKAVKGDLSASFIPDREDVDAFTTFMQ